ncbi:5' nucleotidase, NT5C type [Nannocystis pusilla]|uniref:5' nucleotidase, NT5C type n=1 Tax=Nannocystis pusilla TaxID=889268 RepID=UPI003B769E30
MAKVGLVALIDMDGTLCDYQGALMRDLETFGGPPIRRWVATTTAHRGCARETVIRRQPGWWRSLPRLQLGFDVLAELQALRFEIHVLTKGPVGTPSAWTEKLEWCQQHLPGVPVTITMDKGLVYGKVLVDDWPPYVERWLEWRPRGLVILPAQPWNVGFSHPNAIRYDGHNLGEIRAALRRLCELE